MQQAEHGLHTRLPLGVNAPNAAMELSGRVSSALPGVSNWVRTNVVSEGVKLQLDGIVLKKTL